MAAKTFPTIAGKNLLRQEITFPRDLKVGCTAILLGFQRHHQEHFDMWSPILLELEKAYGSSQFKHYEVPVFGDLNRMLRFVIYEAMRLKKGDNDVRERTVTAYIDKAPVVKALGYPDDLSIHLVLVDKFGRILLDIQDKPTPETEEQLRAWLVSHMKISA